MIIERLKKATYHDLFANRYFWRTWDHQEVDLIEEREGKLVGYEFAWSRKTKKQPRQWLETYPNATYEVINQDNYLPFIT